MYRLFYFDYFIVTSHTLKYATFVHAEHGFLTHQHQLLIRYMKYTMVQLMGVHWNVFRGQMFLGGMIFNFFLVD